MSTGKKHPSQKRESLVGERTRIVNRMKAALNRLGIRGFSPKLRTMSQRLKSLRTPDALPIPPNTLDEMRRVLRRLAIVREQRDRHRDRRHAGAGSALE